MLNLKAIINQLRDEDFNILQNQLIKTKADNSLFLLRSFKENKLTDEVIIEKLNTNVNSFHTLKSRLYDKIQIHLIENSSGDKSDILEQLANIQKYCYGTQRETAKAILLKLESDLIAHDMSGDLISVYSAFLKKIHLNTPKYYEYSQLYNKHLAYTMALEKAEELLGKFNRILSQYILSKSPKLLTMLTIIKQETKNIYQLNKSQHIEIILNIIIIHLQLFAGFAQENDEATDDLLHNSDKIIKKYPNNNQFKIYRNIHIFLSYNYYFQINQPNKAQGFFDELNGSLKYWLLLDNLCLADHFLFSKITNYCYRKIENLLDIENQEELLVYDENSPNTYLNLQFYYALSKFYAGKYRESSTIINNLLNKNSFKDMLYTEIEIKLTLAYLYIKQSEFDLASGLIRSVNRKIKAQNQYPYENALLFSKTMDLLMNFDGSDGMKLKINKTMRLFEFENTGEQKILVFLESEFEKLKKAYN